MFLKLIYSMQKYEMRQIRINGRKFNAIIADSFFKHMIGLMFRKGIGRGECMLFIFRREERHPIWMHNMLFGIDVLWLDGKFRVVGTASNLPTCKSMLNCREYDANSQSRYVVELKAGTLKRMKGKVHVELANLA